MAADQDFVSAIFALSKCYALGIGVRRNAATATKLLSKCADKGDVGSMRILGICYQEGRGIAYSPRKAAWWFRRAADNGDPWGMYYLGECLENGDGERKDPDEAYLWFCRAVMTDPHDERLYQSVQSKIFDPNLKECREKMLKESANEDEEMDVCDK